MAISCQKQFSPSKAFAIVDPAKLTRQANSELGEPNILISQHTSYYPELIGIKADFPAKAYWLECSHEHYQLDDKSGEQLALKVFQKIKDEMTAHGATFTAPISPLFDFKQGVI